MVTIAVTAERDGEPRVAVSPETVKKLTAMGFVVKVQTGAKAGGRNNHAQAAEKVQTGVRAGVRPGNHAQTQGDRPK